MEKLYGDNCQFNTIADWAHHEGYAIGDKYAYIDDQCAMDKDLEKIREELIGEGYELSEVDEYAEWWQAGVIDCLQDI